MRKLLPLIFMAVLFCGISSALNAEWENFYRYPAFFQRGNCRLAFYSSPQEDFPASGINLVRGGPSGNARRMHEWTVADCYGMDYISPSDCWWNDSLWKRAYKTTLEKSPGYKWLCNILDTLPVLSGALCRGIDGKDFILHKGSPVERKVGCRNNQLWLDYRKKDSLAYIGQVREFAGDPVFYDYFASRPTVAAPNVRVIFYDNASFVACACNHCWDGYVKLWNERFGNKRLLVTRDLFILSDKMSVLYGQYQQKWAEIIRVQPEAGALFWEYQTKILTDFYGALNAELNRHGVYCMPNYTQGYAFMSMNQMFARTTDSCCWETSYMHPPFDRLAPWYKRGLAASGGRVQAAVSEAKPPRYIPFWSRALGLDEASDVSPEFTQMALAEGFANSSCYIVKGELLGKFFEPVRRYNQFNIDNQLIYRNAQMAGRVALLVPIRSGLVNLRDDKVTNKLIKRIMESGIPLEVIIEDDMIPKKKWGNNPFQTPNTPAITTRPQLEPTLASRFDMIIAPDFDCATEELLDILDRYHREGGALLISKDFGSHDWYRRPVDFAVARKLTTAAAKGASRLGLIDKYGDNLDNPQFITLLEKTLGKPFPQRLNIPEKYTVAVNMLKQPACSFDSVHIVNYTYKLDNPRRLLSSPDDCVTVELPFSRQRMPKKLYIYGQPATTGCGIDVEVNGKLMSGAGGEINYSEPWLGLKDGEQVTAADKNVRTTINLKGIDDRRWYEINLEEADLSSGKCSVTLKPNKRNRGGFMLFVDPKLKNRSTFAGQALDNGGFAIGFSPTHPAKFVTNKVLPTPDMKLELAGYTPQHKAVLISPDSKTKELNSSFSTGIMTVTVPSVYIYSTVIISNDAGMLNKIKAKNNR